jgi:hypothetical protein
VDVKRFWIYVHTTKVKKGWDWVELPDGRRISVPPGKYMKVFEVDGKPAFGFEDLTEEIGETPDYDYETPMCIVEEELDGAQKVARLRCRFTGRYRVSLYYDGVKVAEFWWGKLVETPQFTHVDVQVLAQQLAQQIQVPPAPPVALPIGVPAFDYIVDIYSDKVVITNPDGTTTQLSTISDLNNWLRNITGKKVRINTHVEIYDDICLSPNEYWIFGEWIHGDVYLLSGKHTIISFTRLGDTSYRGYVTNYDPQTRSSTDVSGLKLYSVYADVSIHGRSDMILRDILIHVEMTYQSFIEYIEGDIYMRGGLINIERSTLHNVYIDADFLSLDNVTSSDYMGTWVMITRYRVFIRGTVNARETLDAWIYLRHSVVWRVEAQSSAGIDLPTIDYYDVHYRVLFIGVRKGTNPYYYDPLPPGVTYRFDAENRRIIIENTTNTGYDIVLTYEITTTLPLY